ncbi:helix-turn-helix domain-containing protein [Spartinivicinus ruber]|uniref:helix-turn-helix domain-containing protein n=1 Tax=Spartinivicinus ruber TaxID=2683272 RepID=UPI0013D332B6|nr:helix-turn-helix transcriptional regulator [Spartinivicinus ruber]
MGSNEFPDRLSEAMRARGLTYAELAKQADISLFKLTQLSNSGFKKYAKQIKKIAKALNVSDIWLMTGVGAAELKSGEVGSSQNQQQGLVIQLPIYDWDVVVAADSRTSNGSLRYLVQNHQIDMEDYLVIRVTKEFISFLPKGALLILRYLYDDQYPENSIIINKGVHGITLSKAAVIQGRKKLTPIFFQPHSQIGSSRNPFTAVVLSVMYQ